MSPARTVLLIAEREVRQRLRARLFVVTTLIIAVLLAVAAAIPWLLSVFDFGSDEPDGPPEPVEFAVVGELSSRQLGVMEQALGTVEVTSATDEDAATELLETGEVAFAVVDGRRILVPPRDGVFAFDPPAASRAAEALALDQLLLDQLLPEDDGSADDGQAREQVGAVLDLAPLPVEPVGTRIPVTRPRGWWSPTSAWCSCSVCSSCTPR